MKVFLSADMEGTCGIAVWPETERKDDRDYIPLQKQMTREVAAACQGALAAGAEEVLVKDAHDSARNILPAELPRNIRMHRSWSGDLLSMMTGLDKDEYGAVFFTGYHAWASCPGNPLSHTMNLRNEYVLINGVRASEFLINAYTAGYYKVPVALLTGDKELCDFAKQMIPAITPCLSTRVSAAACSPCTPTRRWSASAPQRKKLSRRPTSVRWSCPPILRLRSASVSTRSPIPSPSIPVPP